ncbi:MAG: hypothetical protein WC683_01835 [bacterium]
MRTDLRNRAEAVVAAGGDQSTLVAEILVKYDSLAWTAKRLTDERDEAREENERLRQVVDDHECRCPVCGYKAPCARKCAFLTRKE